MTKNTPTARSETHRVQACQNCGDPLEVSALGQFFEVDEPLVTRDCVACLRKDAWYRKVYLRNNRRFTLQLVTKLTPPPKVIVHHHDKLGEWARQLGVEVAHFIERKDLEADARQLTKQIQSIIDDCAYIKRQLDLGLTDAEERAMRAFALLRQVR